MDTYLLKELHMRSSKYTYDFTGTFEVPTDVIPRARRRHQIDFNGDSGSVIVEIDFGAGYRDIKTVIIADSSRLPISLDAVIFGIRVTATDEVTIAYIIDAVN